jgi:hypothetical protein
MAAVQDGSLYIYVVARPATKIGRRNGQPLDLIMSSQSPGVCVSSDIDQL